MAALNFPTLPTLNQQYPTPAIPGVPVYTWDGEKWTTYGASITNAFPATALPLMDATPAVVGITSKYAREDHVHPTDTTRAADAVAIKSTPQTLTVTEQAQARTNVYAAPFDALAYNGMQVNGSMEVSQEIGAALKPMVAGTYTHCIDGWKFNYLHAGGTAVFNSQQSIIPALSYPLTNSLVIISTAALSAPNGTTDQAQITQLIEGYRWARLSFGTANAQPVTIGFWIFATIPGTAAVSLRNNAANRSIAQSFTVNAAATWEYKTVTFAGDTTGTWLTTNGVGCWLSFSFLGGSAVQAANNTWVGTNALTVAGNTNFFATAGNQILLAGVVVLPGIEAPSAARSPLIMRPYDQELVTCKRYWQKLGGSGGSNEIYVRSYNTAATSVVGMLTFSEMRVIPSMTIVGTWGVQNCGQPAIQGAGSRSLAIAAVVTLPADAYFYTVNATQYITLDARL